MPTVVVRDLSVETHRALKQRAARHGTSTQAEIRSVLDAAVREEPRLHEAAGERTLLNESVQGAPEVGFGTRLRQIATEYGGWDLELERRKEPSEPAIFE